MDFLLNKTNRKSRGRPKSKRTVSDLGTPELRERRRKYEKLAETPAFYSCPLVQLFTLEHINDDQLHAGIIYRIKLYQAHNSMGIQLTTKSSLASQLVCYTNSATDDAEQIYWQLSKELWDAGFKVEKSILDDSLIRNVLPINIYDAQLVLEKIASILR